MRHTKKHHRIAGMSGIIHSLVDLNTGKLKWSTSLTLFFSFTSKHERNKRFVTGKVFIHWSFVWIIFIHLYDPLLLDRWRRVSGNLTDRWTFNLILTISRHSVLTWIVNYEISLSAALFHHRALIMARL